MEQLAIYIVLATASLQINKHTNHKAFFGVNLVLTCLIRVPAILTDKNKQKYYK
jgi:hypothetical protein